MTHAERVPISSRFRLLSRSRSRGLALLLVVGALCVEVRPEAPEPPAEVEFAVVASMDVPVSDLTFRELRQLFLFRKRFWKAAQPVTILLSESALESPSYLLEEIYRVKNVRSLRRLILEKLYQEEIDLAPKSVGSCDLALSFVASGRGLLSLVRADKVKDAEVKVLSIDGKLPGDEGYRLRR